jgi:acyl carrier protein
MGLDSVELLLDVEKTFGVDISDNEAEVLLTAGDIHALLLWKLELRPASTEADALWLRLKDVIVESTGVQEDSVVPHARITKDLGIN